MGKHSDAGQDWRQKEKGVTEDEMAEQHHQLNGHELEKTPGDSGGKRSLACYSHRATTESDMTYQLNNNNNRMLRIVLSASYFFFHLITPSDTCY